MKKWLQTLGFLSILWSAFPLMASKTLNIAVASSLESTFKQLTPVFEKESGITLQASYASTGQLVTHIRHGARFDLFLSADKTHVLQLEKAGLAEDHVVYALGELVLVVSGPNGAQQGIHLLLDPRIKTIAVANPTFAPYGLATMQVLEHTNLLDRLKPKIIWGESVGQVASFLKSEAVDAGFMARSQWIALESKNTPKNWVWIVPKSLYHPIQQCATRMTSSSSPHEAKRFLLFLQSKPAKQILQANGYLVG